MQNIEAIITSFKKTFRKQKNPTPEMDFVIRNLKKRTNSTTARKNLATLGEIKATLCEWKKENDEIFSQIVCQYDSQTTFNHFNKGLGDYIERSYSVVNLLSDESPNEERNIVKKSITEYDTYYYEVHDKPEFYFQKHYFPISSKSNSKYLEEVCTGDNEETKRKSIQLVDSFEDLNKKLSNTNQEQNSVYC